MLNHTERARLEPVIDLLILMNKGAYVWISMPGADSEIYGTKEKHGFNPILQRAMQYNVWAMTPATMHHYGS